MVHNQRRIVDLSVSIDLQFATYYEIWFTQKTQDHIDQHPVVFFKKLAGC